MLYLKRSIPTEQLMSAVIVIGLLAAVAGLAQGSLLFIVTVTTSPLFKVVVVKVDAVCRLHSRRLSSIDKFGSFRHWLVWQVNVTDPPVHIEVVFETIDTDGTTDVAVTVIGLLDAIRGLAQGSLLFIVTGNNIPIV
jgi:hypothetical protein